MAQAKDLITLGAPAELAKRMGWDVVSVAPSLTVQNTPLGLLKGPGNKLVMSTPGAGDGAVTLPAEAGIGDEIIIVNMHASNNCDVFPPTGGNFVKLTANQGTPVATGQSFSAIRLTSTQWLGRVVATPAAT